MRRGTVAAATSILLALGGASAAHAATVTVTGDDGNPVALAQGAAASIRNMSPSVGFGFANNTDHFSATFTAPDGVAAATAYDCFINGTFNRGIDFRGNGNYTVVVANYAKADTSCKTPTSTETYVFSINSSVAVGAPAGPFLIRTPNTFTTNTLSLDFAANPGSYGNEIQYALGGVVGPDGAISGPSQSAYVDSTTGKAQFTFRTPGTYTVVARAKNGAYYSPWSAPVTVTAISPFDLDFNPTFPDAVGPKYQIKGTVRDKTIRGRITLALARGTKGGKYKSIGKTSITSKSTFTKRFTVRKTGTYRLRIHYAGSALAPPTSIVGKIKITRRLRFG
jgi:hypothetical protein